MTLADIRSFPTGLEFDAGIRPVDRLSRYARVHESCLRSYQVLEKVKELLEQQVPAPAILEIIADLQSAPGSDKVVE